MSAIELHLINYDERRYDVMNNKKGISAIVATVLIILITVAAVTIIWAAIVPMITERITDSTSCLDANSGVSAPDSGYTCIDRDEKTITIQIKRGVGDFDLFDIDLSIEAGGDSETISLKENADDFTSFPGENEERKYVVNIDSISFDIDDVNSVGIAPLVQTGDTGKKCDIVDTVVLRNCD